MDITIGSKVVTHRAGREHYGTVLYIRGGLVVADWYCTQERRGQVFQEGIPSGAVSLDLHDPTPQPSDTRARNITDYTFLSTAENDFLRHITMWGSDAYPVQKVGRRWIWNDFFGVKGAPTVYKTKRDAFAAVERFLDILRDKSAGRL